MRAGEGRQRHEITRLMVAIDWNHRVEGWLSCVNLYPTSGCAPHKKGGEKEDESQQELIRFAQHVANPCFKQWDHPSVDRYLEHWFGAGND